MQNKKSLIIFFHTALTATLIFSLLVPKSFAQANKPAADSTTPGAGKKPASGNKGNASGATQGQSSSTAPFESQMLAYGAVDEIAAKIVQGICENEVIQDALPANNITIIIYDPSSFAALQSYKGFLTNVTILQKAYSSLLPKPERLAIASATPSPPFLSASPIDLLSLTASSTVENPSTITISDSAVAISIVHHLLGYSCHKRKETTPYPLNPVYPRLGISAPVSETECKGVTDKMETLLNTKAEVDKKIKPKKEDKNKSDTSPNQSKPNQKDEQKNEKDKSEPPKSREELVLEAINKAYTDFINSLSAVDPNTGASLMSSIVQGCEIFSLLEKPNTFLLYEEAIAGGGTQRDRKNLFTNLFWGDLISYSGGAIIVFALERGNCKVGEDCSPILLANTLRYRVPSTRIQRRSKSKKAREGDNLDDVSNVKQK
jgi:hypothetical protein